MDDDLVKRLRSKVRLNADDTYASQFDEDLDELLARTERLSAEKEALQKQLDRLTGMRFSDRMHAALVHRAEKAEARIALLESGQPVEVRAMKEKK